MTSVKKTAASLIIFTIPWMLSPINASGQEAAGCDQGRQELAVYEDQLKRTEDYYTATHTGGSPLSDPDIRRLSDLVQQARAEYGQRCGAGGAPKGSDSPALDNTQNNAVSRKDAEDNPWHNDGTRNNDWDNPSSVSGKPAGAGHEGNQGHLGNGSGATSRNDPDNPFSVVQPNVKGRTASNTKDPTRNYAGESCSYFTKPAVTAGGGRLNYYADESWVCYGDRMYQCKDGHWIDRHKCSAYGPEATHAEDAEN